MCFLYKGVLYADRFQIHDHKEFAPSLTDNKIFVSESGNVVIAIMGKVPENIPDILERLERCLEVWKSDIKAKKDKDNATRTFEQIIKNIDVDMLAVFYNSAKKYFSLVTGPGDDGRVVNHHGTSDQVKLYAPTYIFPMLDAGMTPAQVFKGFSQYSGTISKEFTAYDLKKKKFI